MEVTKAQEEVTIIDKDESSECVINVVGGFLIEESINPFPNGKLSFVPEDYGKKETPTAPPTKVRSRVAPVKIEDPTLPPGKTRCEFCSTIGDIETFLAPSRRFCTVTCCKRYSAEKRYYPYGRDEEGVAMSIRQGLVNRHRTLRPNSNKTKKNQQQSSARDERRRRLAYYSTGGGGVAGGAATPGSIETTPNNRGRRGRSRIGPANSSPSSARVTERSFVEPYTHPHGIPLRQWTSEDVAEFLTHLGYEAYTDKFQEHEIDGRALSLVKDHHLLMTLKLRLGPALKIIEHVNALKNIEVVEED